MEKTMNLNYQYTLFGEFSDIKPEDSDIIIKLMTIFNGENFMPASFQEFSMNMVPPKMDNRISLINKDGVTINIGNSRIDLIVAYNEQGKYKDMDITEITTKAIEMLNKLLREFNKTCNRIALNTMQILSSDESRNVIQKYDGMEQIIKYYNENKPFEWNQRFVAKKHCEKISEEINVITNINKTKGQLANNNSVILFDGIMLQFDINTLPDKLNYRFGTKEVQEFFESVISEKEKIEKNLI